MGALHRRARLDRRPQPRRPAAVHPCRWLARRLPRVLPDVPRATSRLHRYHRGALPAGRRRGTGRDGGLGIPPGRLRRESRPVAAIRPRHAQPRRHPSDHDRVRQHAQPAGRRHDDQPRRSSEDRRRALRRDRPLSPPSGLATSPHPRQDPCFHDRSQPAPAPSPRRDHENSDLGGMSARQRPKTSQPGTAQTWRRDCTTRNRPATNAPSVSAELQAGLAPVPWKSENAADWFTYTPSVRLIDSATPTSMATSSAASSTFSSVEYTAAVSAPWVPTVRRKISRLWSVESVAITNEIGPKCSPAYTSSSLASSATSSGDRTIASGYPGCATVADRRTTAAAPSGRPSRSSTPWLTIAPSSSTARASSPSRLSTAPEIPAATSSNDLCPWSVSIPSRGTRKFCGVVHICPEYSASENAMFPSMPRQSSVESMATVLTPAFSV